MKTCTKCGWQLPFNCYYPRASNKDGLRQPCKQCTAQELKAYRLRPENREKKRQWSSEYYRREGIRERSLAASKKRRRKDHLKYTFGITEDDIDRLAVRQGRRCAICYLPFQKTPALDHDHTTGQIRGLLCGSCNLGLGMFKDDPCRLDRAVYYLLDHRLHS